MAASVAMVVMVGQREKAVEVAGSRMSVTMPAPVPVPAPVAVVKDGRPVEVKGKVQLVREPTNLERLVVASARRPVRVEEPVMPEEAQGLMSELG